MELLKAVIISMSVGCFWAYNNTRQGTGSASVRSQVFVYQGSVVSRRIQKILWICIRKQTRPRSTHTSVMLTHSPPPPLPSLLATASWSNRHARPPPLAGSLCPNVMHRDATHENDLCRNKTARSVIARYKKNEKPRMLVLLRKTDRNRPSF